MTHILVTNDDGVTAPGLLALTQEIRKLGEVTVFAPDRNWSASGHVKTMHRPLRIKEVHLVDGTGAFACDGAPSDCVALALLGYIDKKIDLVVSGINPNGNFGHDVTYSGTVTAAMEAVIHNVPGIAVSLDSPDDYLGILDYMPAARAAHNVASILLERGFPPEIVINLNVPYLNGNPIKGMRITRQGLRVYRDLLVRREDPRKQPYYWIGGEAPTGILEEGTDYGVVKDGYVSITPIQLDLTAYETMKSLQDLKWE